MNPTRKCTRCKQVKPLLQFEKDKTQKLGHGYSCTPCANEHARWGNLKRKFGLTMSQFNDLLVSQNGGCAICGKEQPNTKGRTSWRLAVDHDHKTDQIRGLLCTNCNHGLGCFMDSPEMMRKAIAYLEYNLSTSSRQ